MATADVETGHVPDVIQSGRRPQKDLRTRRYSRKASEGSEVSPRINIPPVDQRRKGRSDVIKTVIQRRQQAALRRSSESALLPPIRVSSLQQPDKVTTREANETSSPNSNVSFRAGSLTEYDNVFNTSSTMLVSLTDREARSPFNRKDTQSNLSVAEATETPRLSPIANSDHARQKPERRTHRSVNDSTVGTVNDATAGTKTPTAQVENTISTPKPSVRKTCNRRVSMQSLPKLTANDEPFSIRRKIEQFRKWHEEQYAEKLKKLKVEAEKEERETEPKPPAQPPSVEIDFAKILEENMKNSNKTTQKGATKDTNGNPVILEKTPVVETQPRKKPTRCRTGSTWRTWRDVNDSYAYNDVMKYIEENELLPPDRVTWINEWLVDVEKAFSESTNKDLEDKEDLIIDLRGLR